MAGASEACTVLEVAAALPATAWTHQTRQEGRQGPMVAERTALQVSVVQDTLPRPEVWLGLRRHTATRGLQAYLSVLASDRSRKTGQASLGGPALVSRPELS
jgi:hypothetical protein